LYVGLTDKKKFFSVMPSSVVDKPTGPVALFLGAVKWHSVGEGGRVLYCFPTVFLLNAYIELFFFLLIIAKRSEKSVRDLLLESW
jgi:hypothetical protein